VAIPRAGPYPKGMEGLKAGQGTLVFRPRPILAALMAAAGIVWIATLVYLFRFEGVPTKTFISAGFFIIFFGISLAYYARTAIVVDQSGVTYRGIVRTQRFSFADILKVDVMPGPVTVYAVRFKGRFVHFTSFFAQHRRLMELLVDRAGLAPTRG
jgi:hypothetical protein